jgi:DNA-binding transcriptional MerR regulator
MEAVNCLLQTILREVGIMKQKNETFSISQVSDMTGVTKNRIREWHGKGFLPDVQSISVGSRLHRRFSEEDVTLIKVINEYQNQGYTLAAAANKAKQEDRGGAR